MHEFACGSRGGDGGTEVVWGVAGDGVGEIDLPIKLTFHPFCFKLVPIIEGWVNCKPFYRKFLERLYCRASPKYTRTPSAHDELRKT